MSGVKSNLTAAKTKEEVPPKADPALREKTGPKVGDALKSLGTAVSRKIRGEGVNAFSSDEKKQWWKQTKKFKIGLIKTSGLDKVINIYGESFDLSKRLTKEERKVFKGDSCQYEDGHDDKQELGDTNYEKAKEYGMDLLNDKGKPYNPEVVEASDVLTTTDFEKLYLGWLYGMPKAVSTSELPADGEIADTSQEKKKLKAEILKGLFRFVFGTAKLNKVMAGLKTYRAIYTDFDVDEKIPCKENPLWEDFKKSLEYRREQAICELHSAKVVIGTNFNQYVEQKTALCVGLADLISILDEANPCFQYSGTEHPVEEDSTFTDEDYARALRVFDDFVNKEKRDSGKFKEALAGLRKPGNEPTPYGELYNKLLASLNALLSSDPQLQKENKDLRKVVGLLTGMLTISTQIFELNLKAKELYCKIKGCCGKEKIEPADAALAQQTLDGYQDEIRRLTMEIQRLRGEGTAKDDHIGELKDILDRVAGGLAVVNWEHDFANGAQALLRRVHECQNARDALVQVIQNIEALNPEDNAEATRLDALLQQAKASKEGFDAVIGELTAGLGRKAAFIGLRNPGQQLQTLRDAAALAERERLDAEAARTEAAAARADAEAARTEAAASAADAVAARAQAAAAAADSAAARATGADAEAARTAAVAAAAASDAARTEATDAAEAARVALTAAEAARTTAEAAAATARGERNTAAANAAIARGERNTAAANAATARGERDTAAADAAVARREAEADRAAKAAADAATAAAEARATAAVAGAGEAATRAAAQAAAEAARLRDASAAADAAAAAAREEASTARSEAAADRAAAQAATTAAAAARDERNAATAAATTATAAAETARTEADATKGERNAATAAAAAATTAANDAVAGAAAEVERVRAASEAAAAAAAARVAEATRAAEAGSAAALASATEATRLANEARAAAEAARNASAGEAATAAARAAEAERAAATAKDAADARAKAAEAGKAAAEAAAKDAEARAAASAANEKAANVARIQAQARAAAQVGENDRLAAAAEAAEARAKAAEATAAAATAATAAAAEERNAATANSASSRAARDAALAAVADANEKAAAADAKAAEAEASSAELRNTVASAAAEVATAQQARAAAEDAARAAANALATSEAAITDAKSRALAADAKAAAEAARAAAAEAGRAAAESARNAATNSNATSKAAAAQAALAAAEAEERAKAAEGRAKAAEETAAGKNANVARSKNAEAKAKADADAARAEAAASAAAEAAARAAKEEADAAAAAARADATAARADAALADAQRVSQEERLRNISNRADAEGQLAKNLAAASLALLEEARKAEGDAKAAQAIAEANKEIAEAKTRDAMSAKAAADEAAAAAADAARRAADEVTAARRNEEAALAAEADANARAAAADAKAAADAAKAAADALALAARTNANAKTKAEAEEARARAAAAERAAAAAEAAAAAAAQAEAERAAAAAEAERVRAAEAEAERVRAAAEAERAAAAAEAERVRVEEAERAAPAPAPSGGPPTAQQIATAEKEVRVSTERLRTNKDDINDAIKVYDNPTKLKILKLLTNQSQIAIASLPEKEIKKIKRDLISIQEFDDKYRYYIGYYRKQEKIQELKTLKRTRPVLDEIEKLSKFNNSTSKEFQALYWGEGRDKGSLWTSDPDYEVEYMFKVLDSMYKELAITLLDNGYDPIFIIKSLKLNNEIKASISQVGFKVTEKESAERTIRTLLGLISARGITNAELTRGQRIAGSGLSGSGGSSGSVTPRAAGASRKQVGGSRSHEFYKSMLILILLKLETNSKEFLAKLKAAMREAGQEDLVMDLLRRIIDKYLKIKTMEYTISFVDLDKQELEGLEEALNGIVLKGDSLHVEAPEEFRDALGEQPYFLVGDGDVLHGLDEEVELEAEEKKALAGGIPMTAVLAMYLLGLVGSIDETFDELE